MKRPAPVLHLHIDRLVLDGVDLERGDSRLFQSALEAELGRLLQEGMLTSNWESDISHASMRGAVQMVPASEISLTPAAQNPVSFGIQVAQTVYQSIGSPDMHRAGGDK